ncbi:uncharacterized protein LOC124169279 [Ischnura elegans]|uniref:uncharacterized protein LOC124169279 n=1 Tax=Ischnura elegans TaxID=197161 RepID=UPI001ED8A21D|nr:uncharacterized protein LOC124169279 [Ischnura elegans]
MEEELDRLTKGLDENIDDEVTENVSMIERRNRRRSSIFAEVRKSLSEMKEANKSICSGSDSQPCEEELLKRYIDELRRERKDWSDIMKKRKQDYEVTSKEINYHRQKRRAMTEKECLPFLEDDDKKYLRNLPNFSKIAKKYHRLTIKNNTLEALKRYNATLGGLMLDLVCEDLEAAKGTIVQYSVNQPV